jgi:hypothetical protein
MLHTHRCDNLAFLFTTASIPPHDGLTLEVTVKANFETNAEISAK